MKSKPTIQTLLSEIRCFVIADRDCRRNVAKRAFVVAPFKLLPCLFLLTSCGWVDSTGVQRDDTPVVTLASGNVLDMIENEALILNPMENIDPQGRVEIWRWGDEPIEAGNLGACQASNGFNPLLAADSLPQACTRAGDCELYFEQRRSVDSDDATVFLLEPPTLRAPVGVTYQLFGTDDSGLESTFDFTFCLISVNEAPDAQSDFFTVIEGQSLLVTAAGPNLLSNDSDDIDVANQPLMVATEPVDPPRFAAEFELFADGGFRYVPEPDFRGTDFFVYSISDGVHEVTEGGANTAMASITVRAVNAPPLQSQPLPEIVITAGIPVSFAFGEFFTDPEGGELLFAAESLPPGLQLSADGELTGQVANSAAGDFVLDLSVNDGVNTLDSQSDLAISENLAPQSRNIPDQFAIEGSTFELSIAGFFSDPEDQSLQYSVQTPVGLSLAIDRRSGVISGVLGDVGDYNIRVIASDGISAVDAEFSLEVDALPNRRPRYTGAIANQSVEAGDSIETIVPAFSDPDGDTLSYEITGVLPRGLEFDETSGTLEGVARAAGIFRNLSIVATDTGGLSASSDTFSITVAEPEIEEEPEAVPVPVPAPAPAPAPEPAPAPVANTNSPPEVEAIADQRVTAGEDFELSVSADDDDDDELLYALDGTASAFLQIDVDTGEITGAFERSGRFRAEVIVSDGPSETSVVFIVVVIVAPDDSSNRAPVADDIPNRTVSGRFSFSVATQFEDPDDDVLFFTATGLPAGVTISRNGAISGRSSNAAEGRHFVVVTADDGRGETISDGFLLVIEN